jgi:hypothetical protein
MKPPEIVCPFDFPLLLAIKDVFPKFNRTTTPMHFNRYLWKLAAS